MGKLTTDMMLSQRRKGLSPDSIQELLRYFNSDNTLPKGKSPTFTKRDDAVSRKHMVFTSADVLIKGKPIRMFYMYCDGKEVGHAGVGKINQRLYNVEIHPDYRGQKLSYRLLSYVMSAGKPTNLMVKSTGGMSDEQLASFYGNFGFKRVQHPSNKFYMELSDEP